MIFLVASSKTNLHASVASFQLNLFLILDDFINDYNEVKNVSFIERDIFYSSDILSLFTLLYNNPCETNRFTCFPSNP